MCKREWGAFPLSEQEYIASMEGTAPLPPIEIGSEWDPYEEVHR